MTPESRVRNTVLVFFVNLALLLSYLREPFFVLSGLFFFESITATTIVLVLIFINVLGATMILRHKKHYFRLTKALVVFLAINSIVNLFALVFVSSDMAGFFMRVFGENIFSGFVVVQILFVLVNAWLLLMLQFTRRVLH